jgi:anti-sigma B factor antagonist
VDRSARDWRGAFQITSAGEAWLGRQYRPIGAALCERVRAKAVELMTIEAGRSGQGRPGVFGDGGDGAEGVVDLSLERSLATQARGPEDLAQAVGLGRGGDRVASVPGRAARPDRPRQMRRASPHKLSKTWHSGPNGYGQLSARLMCSDDGIALLRVAGEVDYWTAPVLGMAVKEALRQGAAEVFVDLAQVSFFDAAGASALVVARQRCQRRGAAFAILRPSRPALRVLSFTDLVGRQSRGGK